ncbi:MAG: YkgJ family cysteine cluster protein [Deltaproteobacteria bacterium]|nr:YkgJ family cysteine cluster protein [Deltaproteobacteria bacterium]
MDRSSGFSYLCNRCGRCCHDQVITLSPYDVIRLARAAGISTGKAIARYTIRRGSILKFDKNGDCAALDGTTCALHSGRPLACRLYPLGLEHDRRGTERYLQLEPAPGSHGIYGGHGSVQDFLAAEDAELHLQINRYYTTLLGIFRQRIAELSDFDVVEPREFWRIAMREALAETNFDFNPIIAALFDPDSLGCRADSDIYFIEQHVKAIEQLIHNESDPTLLAAAAVMLAVSLGYSPGEVMIGCASSPRHSN